MPEKPDIRMVRLVGPFYDGGQLINWLGISQAEIDERVRTFKLIGCPFSDGVSLYPAWQFTNQGDMLPELAEVVAILAGGINDPWTISVWLCARDDELEGMSSAEWLTAGRDKEIILREARRDAERWAH